MKFKVMKGSKKKPVHDSTWTEQPKANNRAKTLRQSLRGMKTVVWVEPTADEEPVYRRPTKGPFTNYDTGSGPRRVDGRRS